MPRPTCSLIRIAMIAASMVALGCDWQVRQTLMLRPEDFHARSAISEPNAFESTTVALVDEIATAHGFHRIQRKEDAASGRLRFWSIDPDTQQPAGRLAEITVSRANLSDTEIILLSFPGFRPELEAVRRDLCQRLAAASLMDAVVWGAEYCSK